MKRLFMVTPRSGILKPTIPFCLPLLLALVVILIFEFPQITKYLQYDRSKIMPYQFYRLFTGHFTHWTAGHMWFDTFFFFLLSYLCIIFKRGDSFNVLHYVWFLLIPALGVSGVLFFLYPDIEYYRGLSALDWGLYGIFGIQLWKRSHWIWKTGAILMVVLFAIKLFLQIKLGHSMFVSDLGPGVVNMPGAHLTGMISGTLLAIFIETK